MLRVSGDSVYDTENLIRRWPEMNDVDHALIKNTVQGKFQIRTESSAGGTSSPVAVHPTHRWGPPPSYGWHRFQKIAGEHRCQPEIPRRPPKQCACCRRRNRDAMHKPPPAAVALARTGSAPVHSCRTPHSPA